MTLTHIVGGVRLSMQSMARAVALLYRAGDAEFLLLYALVETAEAGGAQVGRLVAGLGLHHKAVLVLVHVVHGVPRPITAKKQTKLGLVSSVQLESPLDINIECQLTTQIAATYKRQK